MSEGLDPLILDFLEWLAPGPRPYSEVMEAWRTSCPRLTVWEDAVDRGFVMRAAANGASRSVAITATGRDFLADKRKMAPGGEHAAPFEETRKDGRR